MLRECFKRIFDYILLKHTFKREYLQIISIDPDQNEMDPDQNEMDPDQNGMNPDQN